MVVVVPRRLLRVGRPAADRLGARRRTQQRIDELVRHLRRTIQRRGREPTRAALPGQPSAGASSSACRLPRPLPRARTRCRGSTFSWGASSPRTRTPPRPRVRGTPTRRPAPRAGCTRPPGSQRRAPPRARASTSSTGWPVVSHSTRSIEQPAASSASTNRRPPRRSIPGVCPSADGAVPAARASVAGDGRPDRALPRGATPSVRRHAAAARARARTTWSRSRSRSRCASAASRSR